MKVLLTNDDGIDAAGLSALVEVAADVADVTVVAPRRVLSGCSHKVTTDGHLEVTELGRRRFAVDGTPADCVRVALGYLRLEPDLVLSGINEGSNLGVDVYHSGTVAAVREAAFHGYRGVAISQYRGPHRLVDWDLTRDHLGPVLGSLIRSDWPPGSFWNVNLPHLERDRDRPQAVYCPLDLSPLSLHFNGGAGGLAYAGNYHARKRSPGKDIDVCFGGNIALTHLWP